MPVHAAIHVGHRAQVDPRRPRTERGRIVVQRRRHLVGRRRHAVVGSREAQHVTPPREGAREPQREIDSLIRDVGVGARASAEKIPTRICTDVHLWCEHVRKIK